MYKVPQQIPFSNVETMDPPAPDRSAPSTEILCCQNHLLLPYEISFVPSPLTHAAPAAVRPGHEKMSSSCR